jgi:hypothetical protein
MKRIAGWSVLAAIALLEACAGHGTSAIPTVQQPETFPQSGVTTMSVTPNCGAQTMRGRRTTAIRAQAPNTKYVLYTGNPRSIPIHSHTTTWLEIGPTYVSPSHLPAIHYYEAY